MAADRRAQAQRRLQEAYQAQMDGDYDRAIRLYRGSLALFPTAEAHTYLGWTFHFQGKIEEAIEECKRAIEVDPEFGNPYNDIGAYLIQKGQYNEAIPWLESALKAPRYESYCFPHMNLGRVYEAKREWFRAKEEYRKALEANPDYTPAKQGLARIRGLLN